MESTDAEGMQSTRLRKLCGSDLYIGRLLKTSFEKRDSSTEYQLSVAAGGKFLCPAS